MSDKRHSSVVKDKTATPEKTPKKDDKAEKKDSAATLSVKSPRDETSHKRSSSYRDSSDPKGKGADPKGDKDKDKGGKVAEKPKGKMRYEDVMSPDDPLSMVKELLLEQAAQIASDEELHAAELKYKKNPTSDQSKFDYSVTMVRTRKSSIIENGISNLKGPFSLLFQKPFRIMFDMRNAEIGNTSDLNIARGCLYYIAFAYFRTMKFAYAIQYANASVQENPNNIQAQALVSLTTDIVRFPKAFEDVVMYKKATKDEAALLAPRKSFQGSGVKTTGVDKKNKEIAEMKKTQAKEEEAIKKKEDKEKGKEREREEKEKEKEAKKMEEKRKEEESKRTRLEKKRLKRDAKGGPTWVDELADELDSDSESATSPSDDKPAPIPLVGMSLKIPVPMPSNVVAEAKKEDPDEVLSARSKEEKRKRGSPRKSDDKAKEPKDKKEKDEKKITKETPKDEKRDGRKGKRDVKKPGSIDAPVSNLPIPVPPPQPKTDAKGVVVLDEKEKQLAEREARIAELERKLKEAEEAKLDSKSDEAGASGGLSLDDIINGGDDMVSLSAAIGDDFQFSDNPLDDLDFVKRNIAELSGKLSSIYGIDVNDIGSTRKETGYITDESGMLVRNLVDMDDVTSAVDEAILGRGSKHSDSMQSVLNDILPDLPIPALRDIDSAPSIYGLASAAAPAPVIKERPWVVLRRFNKRGGKKVQLPESMIELKILASDKFGVECTAIREAETEAEVEDINGIKADSVLLVLTAEEEAEFD